jgi:hypothetical protein
MTEGLTASILPTIRAKIGSLCDGNFFAAMRYKLGLALILREGPHFNECNALYLGPRSQFT